MKATNGLLDNLCFGKNQNTKRAHEAFKCTLRKEKFLCVLIEFNYGFDVDTEDVIYFLPLEDLDKIDQNLKQDFLADIRENWTNAGFKIVEEKETEDAYHDGSCSLFIRLRYVR